MKSKRIQSGRKLELNKNTIANLTGKEMKEIKGGRKDPCWENLWTLYYCDVVYTGEPE
jgi:natural product precursor